MKVTYADCLASCRQNVANAVERQGRSEGAYKEQMAAEAAHWREYVRYYERLIAENPAIAARAVTLGTFGKAPSVRQAASSPPSRPETPETPPAPHWSEASEREPGEDDDHIPF